MWEPPELMASIPLRAAESVELACTSTGVELLATPPLPNRPRPPAPQHLTLLPVVTAQVWDFPELMASIPLRAAESVELACTSTGVELLATPPLPNSPELPVPQHLTLLPSVRAQVWESPELMAVISLRASVSVELACTFTGVELMAVAPWPNCPELPAPQHLTFLPVVRAQVWDFPELMAVISLRALVSVELVCTSMGVKLLAITPWPNCPELPFPQHLTFLPVVRAQVWESPELMAVIPLRAAVSVELACTSTGVELMAVAPWPNCPENPFPQHLTFLPVVRAQAWESPELMAVISLRAEESVELACTFTGVEPLSTPLLPNRPELPAPQHLTFLPVVTAQVWSLPELIPAIPSRSEESLELACTSTGVERLPTPPLPNRPDNPYPQHTTLLPVVAQMWELPELIPTIPPRAEGSLELVCTSTGVERLPTPPLPNYPRIPYPQHLTLPSVVRAQVWEIPKLMARNTAQSRGVG